MLKSRYRKILWFFGWMIFRFIWWDLILAAIGLRGLSRRTRPERYRKEAASFRALAIDLGGVMIKVGQFLSARLDILPRQVTDELAGLQDEVRPEAFEPIRRVIECELKAPLSEYFAWVEETPMASASIGQVHRARLLPHPGEPEPPAVVIKVQRPNIEAIVETDLAALRVVGHWLMRYPPIRKHANVPSLLEEFGNSLREEIDYLHEGKNAETFAANFQNRSGVRIPQVIWSHTTQRVLTLEDVQAIKISDYAAIEAAGIDRSEVAKRLFDVYMQQVMEDRFFHADPHPGNLFIAPNCEEGWKLIFVDFGMTGNVQASLLAGLREALVAVGLRDSSRLVHAYQTLGILLPGADIDLLEKAGARAFERFWGKTIPELKDLDHSEAMQFIKEFEALIFEMPFQLPEDFILLGRCVSILSGICSGLDPEFNIWLSVEPYARRLVDQEMSAEGILGWLKELGNNIQPLLSLPKRAERLLDRIEEGKLNVSDPALVRQAARLNRTLRRLTAALVFAVFFGGFTVFYQSGQLAIAIPCAIAAGIALLGSMTIPEK